MSDSTRPLEGLRIVVTRPMGQASHLAAALSELGARPVLFPVLAIGDIEDPAPLRDAAIRLDEFDLAMFVSPNAVEKSMPILLAGRAWPPGLRAVTVGLSSEKALAAFGVTDVIAPRQRFDSEALIELPEFQDVAGKRAIVFRGDGGRELFGDTLKARGAEVEYVTCYRRTRPVLDPGPLLKLWSDGQLAAMTVTSSEGMRNLFDMVGKIGQAWLRKTPLFVPHARIGEQAQALGCHEVIVTSPADDGLIAGLMEYFREHVRAA